MDCGSCGNVQADQDCLDGNTEQGFTDRPGRDHHHRHPARHRCPSYLGFRDRAANNAAKANLRAALPSAEAFYADNGTYAGMDKAALLVIDSGVSSTLTVASTGASSYCLTDTVSGKTWSVLGPGASSTSYKNNATCA